MSEQDPKPTQWKAGVINACVLVVIVGSVFGFNYVVDPFALNRSVDLGFEKEAVAYDLSNYAWKYPEYQHDPKPVVLIGDSRARRLPEDVIEDALGKPTYNFAFGGATAGDAVETFWFAAERGELETVYFGLGALLLNDAVAVQRGQRDRELLDEPLRYYFSPFVTSASARVLALNWFGVEGPGETPPMDEDAFWTYQLTVPPRQYYGAYSYPTKLLADLEKIADYCKEHSIELVFFMPPTHTDLQAKRQEFEEKALAEGGVWLDVMSQELFQRTDGEAGATSA